MVEVLAQSIRDAQSYLRRIGGFAFAHTESVIEFALKLAAYYPAVDARLIEIAAWWHDTGRLYSPDHEKLSAQMADSSLASLGVGAAEREIVYNAIAFHRWSMRPITIEGEIVRDADKLDWVRPGRWTSLLQEDRIDTLKERAASLGSIRNKILHLERSRSMFDDEIGELAEFLRSTDSPELGELAAPVLDYAARTGSTP